MSVSSTVTYPKTALLLSVVLYVLGSIPATTTVSFPSSVGTVKGHTQHLTAVVPFIASVMRIFQSNIQSINTSKTLVNIAIQKHEVDIVMLQETWHPKGEMIFKDYQKPHLKVRTEKGGGGVAIAASNKVKMLKRPEYEDSGLEAVWAEVRKGGVQAVIGSVYINVGKINELKILDSVIEKVLKEHKRMIICMDSNSRNSMWDNEAAVVDKNRPSKKMGASLQEIIERHNLYVHNTGVPTYHSGNHVSAIDLTLSFGICGEFRNKWSALEDEIGSPHLGILLEVGRNMTDKVTVIDWKKFDWNEYEKETKPVLEHLLSKWELERSTVSDKEEDLKKSM